jgi:hypothetical protein
MYFPWVGLLEQIRLADVFIHYDDVQYVRGFYNRVQIKSETGSKWLTVPLRDQHRGQRIDEVLIDHRTDWRSRHREILKQAYRGAAFKDDMLNIVDMVFEEDHAVLADLARASMLALSDYFGLSDGINFCCSSKMEIYGSSSQRLHDLCLATSADVYVTGHGARNYLDHELFEGSGIRVEYMRYQMIPYPQLHGGFNPFVTALDLIANCGKQGVGVVCSTPVYWKIFLNRPFPTT